MWVESSSAPFKDTEGKIIGAVEVSRDVTEKKSESLMTVKELAKYLNVKESWVYAQIREARRSGFPVIKVGKYRRFRRQDVMDWLENDAEYS